eukprot:g10463.t1
MFDAAAPPAPPITSPRTTTNQEEASAHPPSAASGLAIVPAAKKRPAGQRSFDRSKDLIPDKTGFGSVSSFASASAPAEYIKPASIEALEARAAKKHKKQGQEKADAEDIDSEAEALSDEDDGAPPLLSEQELAVTRERYCELLLDNDLCPLPDRFSCYSLNLISYAFAICKDFRGSRPQCLSYLKGFSSAVAPWSMEIKGVYSSAFRALMSIAPQPHGEEGFRFSHIWQLVSANAERGKISLGSCPTAVGTLDMTYELMLRLVISAWLGVMRTESFTTVARQTHPNGQEVRRTHSVGKRQQYGNRPRQVDFCGCCDYAPQVEGARAQICPVCCIRDTTYALTPKITTQQTSRMIRKMLDLVGIENKKIGRRRMYNSHSTRRGGAQSACGGGLSVEKLCRFGGWLSDETDEHFVRQFRVAAESEGLAQPTDAQLVQFAQRQTGLRRKATGRQVLHIRRYYDMGQLKDLLANLSNKTNIPKALDVAPFSLIASFRCLELLPLATAVQLQGKLFGHLIEDAGESGDGDRARLSRDLLCDTFCEALKSVPEDGAMPAVPANPADAFRQRHWTNILSVGLQPQLLAFMKGAMASGKVFKKRTADMEARMQNVENSARQVKLKKRPGNNADADETPDPPKGPKTKKSKKGRKLLRVPHLNKERDDESRGGLSRGGSLTEWAFVSRQLNKSQATAQRITQVANGAQVGSVYFSAESDLLRDSSIRVRSPRRSGWAWWG